VTSSYYIAVALNGDACVAASRRVLLWQDARAMLPVLYYVSTQWLEKWRFRK